MLKINDLMTKQTITQKRSSSLTSVISKVAFAESKVLYDNFELLNIINYQTFGEAAQFKANMNIKLDESVFKSESRLVTFIKSLWATIKRIFKSIIYKLTGVSTDWVKREDYLKKRARTAMLRQNNYKKYTKFKDEKSSTMDVPGYLFPLLKHSAYSSTKNISTLLRDIQQGKINMISAFSRVINDSKKVEDDTDISTLMRSVNYYLGDKQSDFKKMLESITIIQDVFTRKNKGLRPYKIEDFEHDFDRLFFGSDSLMLNEYKENKYVSGNYISLKECIDILNFKDLEPTMKRLYSSMEKVMGEMMANIQSSKTNSIFGTKKIEKSFNELKKAQENFQKLNVTIQKIPKLLHNIFDLYEEIIVIYEKAFVLDRDTFEKNKKTL